MKLAAIGLFFASAWAGGNGVDVGVGVQADLPDAALEAKPLGLGLGWGLPHDDACLKCGDPCTVNGRSGFCGLTGGCHTGPRPLCGGIDGGIYGCTSDADCSNNRRCVRIGLIGKCVARPTTCHSGPYFTTEASAVSRADFDASSSSILPWNNCPSGYKCVNGECVMCPMLKCANPNCPGGTKTPTDSNGCPMCPVCIDNGCNMDSDCPVGQQCVKVGSYGRCQARTCFSYPFLASDLSVAGASLAVDVNANAYPFPWNQCPTGQHCVDGVCRVCPVVDCIPPPCEGPLVPSTMSNGCPGCPKCGVEGSGGCTSDSACPVGQQCVRVGFYGKCQPRTCSSWPYAASSSLAASSDSSLVSIDFGNYWNRCPSGQYCVNGVCRPCPRLACVRPLCPVGSQMYTPTMANGCPGCPRCSSCTGPHCFPVLETATISDDTP